MDSYRGCSPRFCIIAIDSSGPVCVVRDFYDEADNYYSNIQASVFMILANYYLG